MAFDCGANKSKQTRGNCNQYSFKEAINGTNKMRLAEVLDYYYVLYFINPLESAEIKCRRKGKNVLMNDACILAAWACSGKAFILYWWNAFGISIFCFFFLSYPTKRCCDVNIEKKNIVKFSNKKKGFQHQMAMFVFSKEKNEEKKWWKSFADKNIRVLLLLWVSW